MGPHEWILIGLFFVAATVTAVEIRKSKRPRAELAVESVAVQGVAASFTGRSRHILLVGHTAVTRVSIRRALEQSMGVSEARSMADGLERLDEFTSDDIDVTIVVDLTGEQSNTDNFVAEALTKPRDHPIRFLVVTPEPGRGRARPPEHQEARIDYLPHPQSIPSLLDAIRRGDKTVR